MGFPSRNTGESGIFGGSDATHVVFFFWVQPIAGADLVGEQPFNRQIPLIIIISFPRLNHQPSNQQSNKHWFDFGSNIPRTLFTESTNFKYIYIFP